MFSRINTIWWPPRNLGHAPSASNGKIWEIAGLKRDERSRGSLRWREGCVKSVAPHKLLRRREAGAVLMLEEVWAYPMCPLLSLVPCFAPSHYHNISQILRCFTGSSGGDQQKENINESYRKINMYFQMRNRCMYVFCVNDSLIMTARPSTSVLQQFHLSLLLSHF